MCTLKEGENYLFNRNSILFDMVVQIYVSDVFFNAEFESVVGNSIKLKTILLLWVSMPPIGDFGYYY